MPVSERRRRPEGRRRCVGWAVKLSWTDHRWCTVDRPCQGAPLAHVIKTAQQALENGLGYYNRARPYQAVDMATRGAKIYRGRSAVTGAPRAFGDRVTGHRRPALTAAGLDQRITRCTSFASPPS